jgi:regulation of enolase protein 1 (concanavalin A-like superfamily)
MFLTQIKSTLTAVAVVAALGFGGLAYHTLAADGPTAGPAPTAPAPLERLTLGGWGTAFDPDGDCKFTVGRNALTITVPGSDHVLSVERGRMNAPRVLQEVEGDFIAQVRVAGDFPKGAKTVVPERRPLFVAGLLLYVDDNTYVRLERTELVRDGAQENYPNWELRQRGEWLRAGGPHDGAIDGKGPVWLRLERRGGRLMGSHSADGVSWTAMDPLGVKLPAKVRVGVTAGNNTTTGFSASFEGMQLYKCVAGTAPTEAPIAEVKTISNLEAIFLEIQKQPSLPKR